MGKAAFFKEKSLLFRDFSPAGAEKSFSGMRESRSADRFMPFRTFIRRTGP
jgi:hypothetical protein